MWKLIIISMIIWNQHQIQPQASYYSTGFEGKRTAFDEIYDSSKLTAASPYLPKNTQVLVINKANNKGVVVRINDRGPYKIDSTGKYQPHPTRYLDLSKAAFSTIADTLVGVIDIKYKILKDTARIIR